MFNLKPGIASGNFTARFALRRDQERFNLKPGIASGNFTARFALRRDQERYF
jgi:hypothetical protein